MRSEDDHVVVLGGRRGALVRVRELDDERVATQRLRETLCDVTDATVMIGVDDEDAITLRLEPRSIASIHSQRALARTLDRAGWREAAARTDDDAQSSALELDLFKV